MPEMNIILQLINPKRSQAEDDEGRPFVENHFYPGFPPVHYLLGYLEIPVQAEGKGNAGTDRDYKRLLPRLIFCSLATIFQQVLQPTSK